MGARPVTHGICPHSVSLVRHQGQQIDRLIVMGKTLLWVGGGLWALTQFVVPLLR